IHGATFTSCWNPPVKSDGRRPDEPVSGFIAARAWTPQPIRGTLRLCPAIQRGQVAQEGELSRARYQGRVNLGVEKNVRIETFCPPRASYPVEINQTECYMRKLTF